MAISVHILDMYYTFGRRSFQKADHPRGCGEHLYNSSFLPYLKGIIPANAGSTGTGSTAMCSGQDHPRGCGEHRRLAGPVLIVLGSSPRMRGARWTSLAAGRSCGIIPADAGSTPSRGRNANPTQDHPRGCGEHRKINRLNRHTQGSSPRMRGAPACSSSTAWARRIIPADAGSTVA